MGRVRALPLMMSLFLLAGCAGRGGGTAAEDLAFQLQREYAAMPGCAARVTLGVEYDERAFQCVLDAAWDSASGATLTVVEPELVRGITAHIAQGEVSLRYQDISLETGPLNGDGLSPMEVLPTLWRQATKGYIAGVSLTEGALQVTYRQGEDPPGTGLEATVTFDTESHAPLTGELAQDGVRIAQVVIEDFRVIAAPSQE